MLLKPNLAGANTLKITGAMLLKPNLAGANTPYLTGATLLKPSLAGANTPFFVRAGTLRGQKCKCTYLLFNLKSTYNEQRS